MTHWKSYKHIISDVMVSCVLYLPYLDLCKGFQFRLTNVKEARFVKLQTSASVIWVLYGSLSYPKPNYII